MHEGRNESTLELVADREVVIKRAFRAAPAVVFEAWTRPELVRRWWAPKALGVTMAQCDADVRPGGRYRYVIRTSSGEELGFSGEYSEVSPPSRLVYTQVFEPMASAGAVLVTVTFETHDRGTLVTSHEVYPSPEAREGAIASGMADGLRITLEQLDELVASM